MTMLTVALTGGIATGKSVVARILERHGCYIHPADQVAHSLMNPGRPAWQKIVSRFGTHVLNPDRTINRARLGDIVFSSEEERRFLNSLIHPLVLRKKRQVVRRLEKEGRFKIFVSEAALTIEAGFARFFDRVIVVYCNNDIQVRRLMDRDRIRRGQAMKKIRSQMPLPKKRRYADYLIDTSGSLEDTTRQTEEVYLRLLADYRHKVKKAIKKPLALSKLTARRPKAES
jgi:dephospho-CoA kinase